MVSSLTLFAMTVMCGKVPMIVQRDASDCAPAAVSRVLAFYGCSERVNAKTFGTRPNWGTMPTDLFAAIPQLASRNGLSFRLFLDRPQVDEAPLSPARLMALADYRSARYGMVTNCTSFIRFVREKMSVGVPIFQGVTLGIIPEPLGGNRYGGHLRLIIGIDDEAKKIVYTDTWGTGHETKRLSFSPAWAITDFLFTLEPLRKG